MKNHLIFLTKFIVGICFGAGILTSEVALGASRGTNLKTRQTQRGASVQALAREQVLRSQFAQARKWAATVDATSIKMRELTSMTPFQRWQNDIDLASWQKEYSRDVQAHLRAMTTLFRVRRQQRGFAGLREFEFKNMIRKNDYLLALPMTRESLEGELLDERTSEHLRKTLQEYNQERQHFDRKSFSLAAN